MKKELYDQLSYKEKMIYDEFADFTMKLIERMNALTQVMQKLLDVATRDP